MRSSRRTFSTMILVVVLVGFIITPISNVFAAYGMDLSLEVKMRRQSRASEAAEVFYDAMKHKTGLDCIDQYPDFFSGAYLGNDNKLHIRLCGVRYAENDVIQLVLKKYSDVIVCETATHSYNYLYDAVEKLARRVTEDKIKLSGWGVCQEDGSLELYVNEDSPVRLNMSKNYQEVIGDDIEVKVSYTSNSSRDVAKVPLVGGSAIWSNKNGQNGIALTIGASGIYNGSKAFVTSGHYTAKGYEYFSDSNETKKIGVAQKVVCSDGSSGDYAIVKVNTANAETTHKFHSQSGISYFDVSPTSRPQRGAVVRRYGSKTGYSYGTVNNSDSVFTDENGLTTYHLVRASSSKQTQNGDSGGPYWIINNGKNSFCGVHCGLASSGNSNIVVFTPYELLCSGGFTVNFDGHSGPYVYYNLEYHRVWCDSCNQYINFAHNATYSDVNSSKHKMVCSTCETTSYQPHVLNPAGTECVKCGRTGTFTLSTVGETERNMNQIGYINKED